MSASALLSYLQHHLIFAVLLAGLAIFIGIHLIWIIHPSDVKTIEDLHARVRGGQPVVVEFYSNL